VNAAVQDLSADPPVDQNEPALLDCVTYAVGQSDRALKGKQNIYFQFILWSTVIFFSGGRSFSI